MVQHDGMVSLWVGIAASDEALEEFLTFRYTEDGDAVRPRFAEIFGIDRFDEDFREAMFEEAPTRSIAELLKGCSYDDIVIPRFVRSCGESFAFSVNAGVLLYNFRYSGEVLSGGTEEVRFRFMGTVPYE